MKSHEALEILQQYETWGLSLQEQTAFYHALDALERQIEVENAGLIQSHRKCVLGKDEMYSDNTLRSMSKEGLIHLLHIAQHNYSVVLEEYDNRMKYYEKELSKLSESEEEKEEFSITPLMVRRV